jgi:putative endopeptidase
MRRFLIVIAAASVAGAAPGPAQRAPAGLGAAHAQVGAFGFDTAGMETGLAPGANFYRFANGGWDRTATIAPESSNYGMFTALSDLSRARSRTILEESARTPGTRMGDFYASFMNEAAIDAAGITPLRPLLTEIHGLRDRSLWAAALGRTLRRHIVGPFAVHIDQDARDPARMVAYFGQAGLGLSDRNQYLGDDPALVAHRAAYREYLSRQLSLAGEADTLTRAEAVFQFERSLAEAQWDRLRNRDENATYNRWAADAFARNAPGFDWAAFLGAAGLAGEREFIVAQPDAFAGMARVIGNTPQSVLNDYLALRMLDATAPYLSKPFVDARLQFQATLHGGGPSDRPRWLGAAAAVGDAVPDDLARVYVQRFCPPAARAAVAAIARNVIAALDRRLQQAAWLAPATRELARAKLRAVTVKIGYPDVWRDYAGLAVRRDALVQNVIAAAEWNYDRNLRRLGHPPDRREWGLTPLEVNSYANPVWNEIVLTAAILQPPFFDPGADDAINYGGIGAVIGAVLSHHFDDEGSGYDATGARVQWWTPDDHKRFDALAARLVSQYDAYEPLPGMHVNGRLTMNENFADLSGVTIAYDAYRDSLAGRPAPVIGGYDGDQRFYLGWAQIWRRIYREGNLRQRLLTDPHAPSEQRTNLVRNLDSWYAAFHPAPTDALFLAPEQRVHVW